jgi:hypothetical protein
MSAHMHITTKHYTVLTPTQSKPVLKVAIDVHPSRYVCAIQEDGSHPKPPQRFKPTEFLKWVEKKLSQGWRVVSCYEAGPFGYVLHRQLIAMGAINYVVRPRNWVKQLERGQLVREFSSKTSFFPTLRLSVSALKGARTAALVPNGRDRSVRMSQLCSVRSKSHRIYCAVDDTHG